MVSGPKWDRREAPKGTVGEPVKGGVLRESPDDLTNSTGTCVGGRVPPPLTELPVEQGTRHDADVRKGKGESRKELMNGNGQGK